MGLYDSYYKKVVGASKEKGSFVWGLSSFGRGFRRNFFDSRHARLRVGLVVLTLAGGLTYGLNKSSFDEKLNDFKEFVVERRDFRRLGREAERVDLELTLASEELGRVRGEYFSLVREVDSLGVVYSDLGGLASSKKEYLRGVVDSLESKIGSLVVRERALSESISYLSEGVVALESEVVERSVGRVVDSCGFVGGVVGEDLWVPVPAGSSLSKLALDLYGDASVYRVLAVLNDLVNPDLVLRAEPIRLKKEGLVTLEGVMVGEVPLYRQVKKREFIDDFISRVGLSVSRDDVLLYNRGLGNHISCDKRLVLDTDVVYLKSNWFD